GRSAGVAGGRGGWRRGRNATDSRRRAGPRRSGLVTPEPVIRFRSATTLSVPSSVRTAQAQEVGPCTRTPFERAIPPSRTFSPMAAAYPSRGDRPSLRGAGEGAQPLLERPRSRARRAVAERATAERDRRQQLADRGRRERLVGGPQLVDRERPLLDPVADAGGEFDHHGPRHAGEDPDREGGREEHVAATPPDVRDR